MLCDQLTGNQLGWILWEPFQAVPLHVARSLSTLYQIWCFKTSVSGTYLHTHPLFLNIPKTLPSVIFFLFISPHFQIGQNSTIESAKNVHLGFFVRSNGKSQTNFLANLVLLSPFKKCLESSFPLNFHMKGSLPIRCYLPHLADTISILSVYSNFSWLLSWSWIADRLSWENGIGAPTVPFGGFILQWAEASPAQRETGCLSPSSTLLSTDEETIMHVYLIWIWVNSPEVAYPRVGNKRSLFHQPPCFRDRGLSQTESKVPDCTSSTSGRCFLILTLRFPPEVCMWAGLLFLRSAPDWKPALEQEIMNFVLQERA